MDLLNLHATIFLGQTLQVSESSSCVEEKILNKMTPVANILYLCLTVFSSFYFILNNINKLQIY